MPANTKMCPEQMEAEALVSALCSKHKHTSQAVLGRTAQTEYKDHVLTTFLPEALMAQIALATGPDISARETAGGTEHRASLYAMNRGELVAFAQKVIQCQYSPVLRNQILASQQRKQAAQQAEEAPHDMTPKRNT